jgi:hypothetical protein
VQFELTIECKTKAFGKDDRSRSIELANILTCAVAELVDEGLPPGATISLRDRYGETVGKAHLREVGANSNAPTQSQNEKNPSEEADRAGDTLVRAADNARRAG